MNREKREELEERVNREKREELEERLNKEKRVDGEKGKDNIYRIYFPI
ncbi:hypothetical protein ACCE85_000596 [Photobacterium damselae]